MAFVPVPIDLSKVKTKVMFNLTTRQLVCFGSALVIAIPSYILLQRHLSNEISLLIVGLLISPLIFLAIFEKDGLTGEKYIKKVIEVKFRRPSTRVYRNSNYYEWLNEVKYKYQDYTKKHRQKQVR